MSLAGRPTHCAKTGRRMNKHGAGALRDVEGDTAELPPDDSSQRGHVGGGVHVQQDGGIVELDDGNVAGIPLEQSAYSLRLFTNRRQLLAHR
jgi:hypothetical protein